jgi:hypothetical protein
MAGADGHREATGVGAAEAEVLGSFYAASIDSSMHLPGHPLASLAVAAAGEGAVLADGPD